jgi:hypothetical protein
MLDKHHIYEFDLKQFFPSVHVNEISETLIRLGMPKQWVYWLENIHRNSPELPKKQLLNEEQFIMSEKDKYEISKGIFNWDSKLYNGIKDFLKHNGKKSYHECFGNKSPFEVVQEQWALMDHISCAKVPGQFVGVPQGSRHLLY